VVNNRLLPSLHWTILLIAAGETVPFAATP
jgi:hypothetical protein